MLGAELAAPPMRGNPAAWSAETALHVVRSSAKGRAVSDTQDAIAAAERAGFDLSLVDSNLRLTYEERVERHEAARLLMEDLRRAGRENARTAPSAATAR